MSRTPNHVTPQLGDLDFVLAAPLQVTMQEMLREYLMKGRVEKIQPLVAELWSCFRLAAGGHQVTKDCQPGLGESVPAQGHRRARGGDHQLGPAGSLRDQTGEPGLKMDFGSAAPIWCLDARNVQNELGIPSLEHIPIQYVYETLALLLCARKCIAQELLTTGNSLSDIPGPTILARSCRTFRPFCSSSRCCG